MRKLWIGFTLVLFVSFLILGWIGTRIYEDRPPIPVKVVTTDGQIVIDTGEIQAGQNVWQSLGGMEVGSIWGHGSYVAPDWTADWLHRESMFILDRWANTDFSAGFDDLNEEQQGQLSGRLTAMMRTNTYDPANAERSPSIRYVLRRLYRICALFRCFFKRQYRTTPSLPER